MDSDPHGEFTGKNILYQAHTVEETARHFGQPPERRAGRARKARRSVLMAARAKRVRPHLDDKILTAWNGLMISAFAKGGAVLEDARYAEAARRAAEFVIAQLYDAGSGTLLRRYRDGRRRDSRLPRRLCHVHPGPARSLRSAIRPAPSGTGHAAHGETAGAVRRHRIRAGSSARRRTITGWSCG